MSAPSIEQLYAELQALKGDMTIDYLAAQGGQLPLPMAKEIIVKIQEKASLLSRIPFQTMRAQIEPVGPVGAFVGRVSHADVMGVTSTADNRVSMTLSDQQLTAQRMKAVTYNFYQLMDENVIGAAFGVFQRDRLADAVQMDMEYLALRGDVLSVDTDFYGVLDGWVTQATNNGYILDWSADPVALDDHPLYALVQAIEQPFIRNRSDCIFLMSPRAENAYNQYCMKQPYGRVQPRVNPDYAGQLEYGGIPFWQSDAMPDDTIMLVPRSNLVAGIWNQMSYKEQEFVDPGIIVQVFRYACDFKFVQTAGVMVLKGIDVGTYPSGS